MRLHPKIVVIDDAVAYTGSFWLDFEVTLGVYEPELDRWDGKGTHGSRFLIRINEKLSDWIENTVSIKTFSPTEYYVQRVLVFCSKSIFKLNCC